MKKYTKILMLVLLVSSFSGCNKITVKDGTEAAKILLANERLDESDLQKDGNIFTKGKKAFDRIKTETQKYSKRLEDEGVKSKFNKSGNTYTWSDAPDYSNFLSFFNSYAVGIEFNAETGSRLIDDTKKNVRVVNKWVEVTSSYEFEILLIVDENAETIFSRSGSQYEICRRYQNEEGSNVFEMAIENFDSNSRSRMTYIPGQRYEYSSIQDDYLLVIIADNEKGYWDIMTTSTNSFDDNNYIFTNLVMKDEAIYQTTYFLENNEEHFDRVKVVTGDAKSDILDYSGNEISIYTTGIEGLDSFYVNATDDEVWDADKEDYPNNIENYKVFSTGEGDDKQYFTQFYSPIVKFTNGKEMKAGDTFYDGAITFESSSIAPIGGIDFYGKMNFNFKENNIDYIFDNLKKLSKDFGFTFKDDFDVVYESTKYADQDKVNFSKYYIWQGNHINNVEDIKKSFEIERELINSFVNLYNEVKDYEVIKKGDQAKLQKSYHFADISYVSNSDVEVINNEIKVNVLNLRAEDTILFVQNEKYKIELAVANEENGEFVNIMPLNIQNPTTKEYTGESKFEIMLEGEVTIPELAAGDYIVVAYIATSEEGIRVTKPIALEAKVYESTHKYENITNRIYGENNKVKIIASKEGTFTINLTEEYTYSEIYELLESYAYKYGETTGSKLQREDNGSWIDVNGQNDFSGSKFRLKYIFNGQEAYIYANFVV